MDLELGKVPFREAIDFFQAKRPMGSQAYTDLVHAMHDRAFVLAGVTRQDVLTDVQALVQKAIAEGVPLKDFQRQFSQAIAGKWIPTNKDGEENTAWRSRVIYETNVRTAYAAGRYRQLQELTATHPFWKYRHGDSRRPRPQHLAWDGMILKADDPWWNVHYPPNGWGCRCFVDACDDVDLEDSGRTAPDQAPPDAMRQVKYGDHTIEVPAGVDPGWGYAPGQNWNTWPAASPGGTRPQGSAPRTPLLAGNWESYGLPRQLPAEASTAAPLGEAWKERGAVEALRHVLGGDQKILSVKAGDWTLPLVVDAESLGGHLPTDRIPFLPLILEAEHPAELWGQFYRSPEGRVVLRFNLVKAVEVRNKKLLLIAEGNDKGVLEAFNFWAMSRTAEINKARQGRLLFARSLQ